MMRRDSLGIVAAALLSSAGCGGGTDDQPARVWSQAGSLVMPRAFFSITLLQSGKVLVAGGQPDFDPAWATGAVDLFAPSTRLWTAATPLNTPRNSPCAVLLPSGKVLVAGGANPTTLSLDTAERYDPAAGAWAAGPRTIDDHGAGAGAVKLQDGTCLLVGGVVPSDVYVRAAEILTE